MKKSLFLGLLILAGASAAEECSPLGKVDLGQFKHKKIFVKSKSCEQDNCYEYQFTTPNFGASWLADFVGAKSFALQNGLSRENLSAAVKKVSAKRILEQTGLGRDGWSDVETHGHFSQLFRCQTQVMADETGEDLLAEPQEEKTYYVFSTVTKKPVPVSEILLPNQKVAFQNLLAKALRQQLAEMNSEDAAEMSPVAAFPTANGWFFDHGKLVFIYSSLPEEGERITISIPVVRLQTIVKTEVLQVAEAPWQPNLGNCLQFATEEKACLTSSD